MSNKAHAYLGDGVYASHDGFQVWLHLGDHTSRPIVALEPEVLKALCHYAELHDLIPPGVLK